MLRALILIACLSSGAVPAQDPEGPRPPKCIKCASTARLPCGEHRKTECALEDEVLYCSVVAGCEECGGTGYVDCPRCEFEPVESALTDRREAIARCGKDLAWVDQEMGRELRKVESEHMVLVWEMDGMKVGRERLNAHDTMHLYARRLEVLFDDYCGALQAKEREFRQKPHVFVWYLPKDQKEASLRFCSNGSFNGVKLLGATPRYSVCGNRQFFKDDETLHRSLMHNVGHLLLSHQNPAMWIGDKKYGWVDEGLAHWFEWRYFERCTNYCYQEVNTNVDFKGGRYKPAVRKMVAMGDAPPIALVMSRTTQELTLPEHAVSFSYVDYLLHLDGNNFDAMAKSMRRKVPSRDALKGAYGFGPLEMETAWKEWVLATYPAR